MIFISYRRNDPAEPVRYLANALRAKMLDVEVFTDIQNLQVGVDFRGAIIRAIWQSTIMIVVIGPVWNPIDPTTKLPKLFSVDDVVRLEIEEGLKRNLLMVPVVLPEAAMPRPSELPSSLHALCGKGARILRSGDLAGQIESLVSEIDDRRPEITEELEAIADGLVMEGSPKKALPYYHQAITLSKTCGRLFRKRALALEELQEVALALADFDHAITLDASDALAWAGRSHHYSRVGQLDRALSDINETVNLTVSNPVAYSMRSYLLWEKRRYLDAMKDLANCIMLDPDNVSYRLRRIEAYIELKHPELAKEDIDRVHALDPTNTQFRELKRRL